MKTKLMKITISSVAFAAALLCLAATMVSGTSSTARAAAESRVCSVGMLKGLYVWTFDGYANLGPNLVPKAVLQGLQFNGDGTTSGPFGTVNVGGTIIIDVSGSAGTYTVAPDCTGTISITDGPSFNMYVGPGGQQVWTTQIAGGQGGAGLGVGTATRVP